MSAANMTGQEEKDFFPLKLNDFLSIMPELLACQNEFLIYARCFDRKNARIAC